MASSIICKSIACHNARCLLLATSSAGPGTLNAPLISQEELRERSFHKGYRCPRCGSEHLHRHGRYRDRQRFRCVDCGRTFNERTLSPMHGTHYPEKWTLYAACLARGYSLRLTAALVGISLPTSFAWRHKLLHALGNSMATPSLEGIIEFDEVYVLESKKGNRNLTRPARERGTGRSVARGPGKNRVCVLAGLDRRDGSFFTVVGARELHVFQLENALEKIHFKGTALCVDNRQAYWSFSRRHYIARYIVTRRAQRRGLHHFRRVDSFLDRFRVWLLRFNGVATRYLANYAHWFLRHDRAAMLGMCDIKFARHLLLCSFNLP